MKSRELNFYKPHIFILRLSYLCFLLAVIGITLFFVWTNDNYAKEVVVVNESTVASSVTPRPLQFTMLEKIKQGREILKKSPPLEYETKNKKTTGELVRKQISLAILNTESGEVFEKRFWVKEQEIKNYKKTHVINLEAMPSTSVADGLKAIWWNSFNSDYAIPGRPELIVVANKYLFPSKYLSGLPERSSGQYTDIIYSPYSKGLHTSEVVEAGKAYLHKNIEQAFTELNGAKVKSRLVSGSLITEDISKDFLRNILVVEHVDPDAFRTANDGGKELSERVLTIIGANQEAAYRYTGSPAGASGLAQFIQPTYKSMISKYPEARMIKDYNAGMANHANAVKAMVLFFDTHKKDIASRVARKDIVRSLGITEEMLAAAYNGGPGRVVSSVNKFGLAWISNQISATSSDRIFRKETLDYIKKFRAIKSLNIF